MKSHVSLLKCALLLLLCAPLVSKAFIIPDTADLALAKTASTDSVKVGDQFSFLLSVTNLGPDNATNVTVQDVLPSGVTYVFSGGTGTYNPTNGVWSFSAGSAGDVSFMTISVQAANAGTFTNSAVIQTSNVADTNSNNNTAGAVVTVHPLQADLAIAKTASTNSVMVGDFLSFQLSVTNLGPDNVTNATVQDVLPAGFTYNFSGGTGTYNPFTGIWNFSAGSPGVVSFMTIFVQATNAGTFTNTAIITGSDTPDPNTNNNYGSVGITVSSSSGADLSLDASGPATAPVGQAVTLQISLHNNGPDVATNIIVEEYPTAGLSFIGSSAPSGTTYDSDTGLWNVPALTNGETQTLLLTAAANAPGTITNRNAIIASSPTDPNPSNDTASAIVVFREQFILAATAGADGGISPSGSIVKNAGADQSFSALPDPNYGVDEWFVDGNLVQSGGPGFTLSNILADHSVLVTFRTGPFAPFITQQPQSQTLDACTVATLAVTAVGTEPFTNQWYFGEQPIAGATNASLSLAGVKPDEAGDYSVRVLGPGGSVTSVVAVLTVLNDVPPMIACPTNLAVPCSAPGGAQVFFSVTAVDDCDTNVSITCNPPSGSFFPIGDTTVVCTARDSVQNSSICRFTVTVFDQNPPVLAATLQGDQVVITWPNGCGVYVLQQTAGLNPPAWTPLAATVMTNGGFNMMMLPVTNSMQFFSLGDGFQVQFVTPGTNGEIVPQAFTYNSAPCPQIAATIDTFMYSQTGQVTLSLSGTVVDAASDLVDSPAYQVQELQIYLENQLLATLTLTNQATPALPWKPYRFEAPFSADLTLPTPGLGTFRLQLMTATNVAGCSGELIFDINVDDEGADVAINAANEPGTFLPTMLRVDAPESAFLGTGSQIRAFDHYWMMQRQNWGDGYYWYAVDGLGKPVVFLPAAYAHSYIQTKKIEIEFKAEIVKGAAVEGKGKIPVENGLLVTTDDVEALLAPLKNYEKKGYQQVRGPNVFIYRPAANYDRKNRTDKSVKTEILWRYVGTEETMVVFIGSEELDRDLLYRQKIVEATTQAKFPFGGSSRVNNDWWVRLFQVKAGKSATDALADIFNNRASDTLYRMACYPAAHSIQQRAASQALTQATFDGVMYGRDTFKNAWRVKAQLVQPNEARWIPGDWGYLQNTDPNGTNRAGSSWGLLCGENVIYVGGSFDTTLEEFKNNAVFWGHFDPRWPTLKLKEWLAKVDRFTGTQAEVVAGSHWGKIGKNRYLLRQPAEAGSLLLVNGADLTANAFAGGSAKVSGNNYAIVANNAKVVRTATAVSLPFTVKKGQNQKNGTLFLFSTADGKTRVSVTGISLSSNEFKDGKMTVEGTDYDITGNTVSEISTATAVSVPVELKKDNSTETRNITQLHIP